MGVLHAQKDGCGHIANGSVLSVIVKRSGLEILILPRREAPFLSVCAPVDHFKETRSTSVLVSPRPRARRRLLCITGRAIPGARWLRDQSRSRLNGLRSVMACLLIMLSAFRHARSPQNSPLWHRQGKEMT
jgi:hypothetical protein